MSTVNVKTRSAPFTRLQTYNIIIMYGKCVLIISLFDSISRPKEQISSYVTTFNCMFRYILCNLRYNFTLCIKVVLPVAKTEAGYSGVDVAKAIITNSSPGTIMVDFQTSLV